MMMVPIIAKEGVEALRGKACCDDACIGRQKIPVARFELQRSHRPRSGNLSASISVITARAGWSVKIYCRPLPVATGAPSALLHSMNEPSYIITS